jgi:predicted nucleotidyltransferase
MKPVSPTSTVSAGTQVVVTADILGTNDEPVHPRGAVGIVARTPAGTEQHYLIRFPDGFETSFMRDQFEILRHFKDRLGGAASADFALEDCVIFRVVVGSRAYGLDHENSDTDRRGIYLAPLEMQFSLFGAPEQFEDNQAQSCYWELRKFLVMALKANPNVLECLYSPLVEKTSAVADELLALRGSFLSQMVFQTFNGYALSQFKKLDQDRRNQGEIRWKHAMHLLRLLLTGTATLHDGFVPVRVDRHRDRLLAVKRGELPWAEVDAWRQELHRDFEHALGVTKLPERPDYEAVNHFLNRARHGQFRHSP